MRKYTAIAKILFKAQIIYRFDVAMTTLGTIGRVFFAWLVWGAIFEGHNIVGGFDFEAMLMYYVISSFLSSMDKSWDVSGEVSSRIRGGTFSKFMVIPANPQANFLAQNFGATAFYAIFTLPVAIFSGVIFGAGGNIGHAASIALGIAMIPWGMTLMVTYHYLIGLMAFKFQDVWVFRFVQSSIIQFTQGVFLPLNLLPDAMLSVLKFLPFPHVAYTPTLLIMGRVDLQDGLFSLFLLVSWTAIAAITAHLAYHSLRIKYDGVGI